MIAPNMKILLFASGKLCHHKYCESKKKIIQIQINKNEKKITRTYCDLGKSRNYIYLWQKPITTTKQQKKNTSNKLFSYIVHIKYTLFQFISIQHIYQFWFWFWFKFRFRFGKRAKPKSKWQEMFRYTKTRIQRTHTQNMNVVH